MWCSSRRARSAAYLAVVRDAHWSAAVRDAGDVALRRVMGEPIDEVNEDGVSQVIADHRAEGTEVHGTDCEVIGDLETMQSPPQRYARLGKAWVNVSESDGHTDDDTVDLRLLQRLPAAVVPGDVHAVVVDGATIIGRDAGEWGGDLHVVDQRGVVTRLLAANVVELRTVGDVVLAFTGLAHMGINKGAVYRVHHDRDGWHAEPLVALPGVPYAMRAVPHASAFVIASENNAVVVGVDGTIETLACRLVEPR